VERSRRDLLLEPDQLVSVVTRRFAAGGEADLQEVLVREEDGDCSIVAFADDADLNVAHTAKLRNRTEGWNRITRPGTPAYAPNSFVGRVPPPCSRIDFTRSYCSVVRVRGAPALVGTESKRTASSNSRRCASRAAS